MKSKTCIIFLLSCMVCNLSCRAADISEIKALSGSNYSQLECALKNYRFSPRKYLATRFLIKNMWHQWTNCPAYNYYRETVMMSDSVSINRSNEIWYTAIDTFGNLDDEMLYDARVVTSEYLIKEIDSAFDVWKRTRKSWHVSFRTFCHYVLPYRVLDEPLTEWRSVLNKEYGYLVENEKDIRKAYSKLYKYLINEFDESSLKCPYTPDMLLMDRQKTGICSYRCMYMVCVMRSVGLPVSYDMIRYWANYSTSGHSWVALCPSCNRTETMQITDSLPKKYNVIDASVIPINANNVPVPVETKKKTPKIYRMQYEFQKKSDNKYAPEFFKSPFIKDVSNQYVCTRNRIKFALKGGDWDGLSEVYLCTFASIYGWQAAAKGKQSSRYVIFDNIGNDMVYLPVCFDMNGQMIPLSNPFILTESGEHIALNPSLDKRIQMSLTRKFVLMGHWPGRWSKMWGATVEASNDVDFENAVQLHEVNYLPIGITRIRLEPTEKYRYVRLHARWDAMPSISEIMFFDHDIPIKPNMGGSISSKSIETMTDGDYSTSANGERDGYWIGVDFLNPVDTMQLEFCMKSDMNMVVPGNRYELFYYDKSWVSLGIKTAESDSLTYQGYENALYWLRCLDGGREERIFTYQNNQQIWW